MLETIASKRLILRAYTIKDVDDVHYYASHEDIAKYTLWGPNTYEETVNFVEEIIQKFYQEKPMTHLEYAIEYESKMIGGVSIHLHLDKNEGEMGWILNPNFHHLGIATEAAEALKQYAQKKYNLHRILATCDARNKASIKVMMKLGMTKVKTDINARKNKENNEYEFDELTYEVILAK
ncbi:MAG: GNAT family N-acetyltransferase [Acholeplasmataceae bacterium]